jgi:hypothetical protein
MKKSSTEYMESMLSKLLMEEIRKEIDMDFMKSITDPNYISQTSPMLFESEEDKQIHKEHYDKMWNSRNDFLKNIEEE